MIVHVLCTDPEHPVYSNLARWVTEHRSSHDVMLTSSVKDLTGGNLLFLVSAAQIIRRDVRDRYEAVLVLHASDLPRGRGWSPHIWQVLEGKSAITLSLLAAEDAVDTGAIWAQRIIELRGDELADEINSLLFAQELALMDFAVDHFGQVTPKPQPPGEASYYRKRTLEDSRIDPYLSISEQFNLLRVADPLRYPAFFDLRGCRYKIVLEKLVTECSESAQESKA